MRKILAWSVHLLTASGAVLCLLAIQSAMRQDWRTTFAWLFLAVLVDSCDGTLARLVRVKEVLPKFDGTLLDNLIDYASYVIVPAFVLLQSDLLNPALSFWIASGICVASAYQFCQADAKSPDHAFTGFPSYWNIAVLYLIVLNLGSAWNAIILVCLIVLVFVPIKYLYPNRTPRFRLLTITLTILWGLMVAVIIWLLPRPDMRLVYGSMCYFVYYVAMSLYLGST